MKRYGIVLLVLLFVFGSIGLYFLLDDVMEKLDPKQEVAEEEPTPEPEPEGSGELSALPLPELVEDATPAQVKQVNDLIANARDDASIDRWEQAKSGLRRAIDSSSNATLRAMAAQEMGNVLLQESKITPWPNALAAQQYLRGSLELDTDDARKEKTKELLAEAEKILYGNQLKTLPEMGSYYQMQKTLEEARPRMTSPEEQLELKLREANIKQRVVMNRAWMREYLQDHPDVSEEDARSMLRDEAIADYSWISEHADGDVRDEAYFRAAQLLVHDGQYARADKTIQAFLNNEPMEFIPETMMLLARIARATGDPRKATNLLKQSIDRFGVTREAQVNLLEVVDDLVAAGYNKDASEALKQLSLHPQMEYQGPELFARSQLLMAQYYRDIEEPNKAQDLLSRLVMNDSPPGIKQAAVSMLFDMQLSKDQSNIEMLLTGIQAVEADPDNEHAKTILVQMAKTVEQMGLPQYAQEIYEKIALMGMAMAESTTSTNVLPLSIEAATLGTARCFYKEGNDVKADYLLRRICNNYEVGPLQSESAFWWAQIAFKNNQLQEASRRLGLMDLSTLPPAFTAKAEVLDQFINIRLGISNEEVIGPVLEDLAMIPETDHEFLRTYYADFFDMWESRGNPSAMEAWYEGCLKSPHRGMIPLTDYFYRIANMKMQQEGLFGALSFIRKNEANIGIDEKDRLLNDLWVGYLPAMQQINMATKSLKLGINELYARKFNTSK